MGANMSDDGEDDEDELMLKEMHANDLESLKKRDKYGNTKAHWACFTGNMRAVRYLLKHCPDLFIVPNHEDSLPLRSAFCGLGNREKERQEIIIWLFQQYPAWMTQVLDDGRGSTWMHLAVTAGLPRVVEYIGKEEPAQVHEADFSGLTPLHCGGKNPCDKENTEVLKRLLESRADVNAVDKDGNTPLDLAVMCNSHVSRECLEGWIDMPEEKCNLVIAYGWDDYSVVHFEMQTWRLRDHTEFPDDFRAQVHAAAVSLSGLAPVLNLIAKAIDALKRKRALEL